MSEGKKLHVAFLWHMHQPWYLLDHTGTAAMPWVRLHALRDYYDVPRLMEQKGFPGTINLVPCLLRQIQLLSDNETNDPYWDILIANPRDLTDSQRSFMVSNFIKVNYANYISKSPRYTELMAKYQATHDYRSFSEQELFDLQIHYLISWFGETLKKNTEVIKLIILDKNFTTDDKKTLISIANKRISEIIPYYHRLFFNEIIEPSTSPFYHPILPLLCDIRIAKQSNPRTTLPNIDFMYPSDASVQIKNGLEFFVNTLHINPECIWSSEGSLSEEIIPLLIHNGFKVTFGDEDVLKKSQELLYGEPGSSIADSHLRPRKIHRSNSLIHIFFRDKTLSDNIGFKYYNMEVEDAVNHFLNTLHTIRKSLPEDDNEYIASIMLDGENAWEYYDHNGLPFLTKLYESLLSDPDIEPTTFKKYLSKNPQIPTLDRLAPGSWIASDFSTWCGDEEKNKAWKILAQTRDNLTRTYDKMDVKTKKEALEHMMIAEGSDWFWWYGETNFTPHMDIFDSLFRHHLKRVYELSDTPLPADITETIHQSARVLEPIQRPMQFIHPKLDGKPTSYFEWSSAGIYKVSGFRGAMHGSEKQFLERIFFGFDLQNLYLRLDSNFSLKEFFREGGEFLLEFTNPKRIYINIFIKDDVKNISVYEISEGEKKSVKIQGLLIACERSCEIKIPFISLNATPDKPVRLVVYTRKEDSLDERFPSSGQCLEIVPPDQDFEDRLWFV